ncbi:AfsR/SARP family transcriptional regulator, partial [Saccharothrix algeriensis]
MLAVLAVRAGQAVSRDELIGGVWGDSPPATAGASLYTYVSGLRRAFEPQRSKRSAAEVIVSTGGGYSLRVDPDCLDVHRFERHRSRAQALAGEHPARALAELDRALALWRGDALHDVPGPFAEAQRARLLELRLATVERRAELALALGRHAEVVAGLADLAAEHPVREGLHALLVTALHRAGRRAEALAVYRDAHRALVDGLGIEPGSALRRAHREVLGADAAGVGRVDRRAPDDSDPGADHPGWWAPDDSAAGDDALGWWGSDDSATAADHPGWWAADDSAPEGGEQDWWAPDGGATAADHPD